MRVVPVSGSAKQENKGLVLVVPQLSSIYGVGLLVIRLLTSDEVEIADAKS